MSTASSSASLARRFQQNWLAQHPQDNNNNNIQGGGCNLDDSLTSLGWLQNLKVSEITQPRQTTSPCLTLDNNRNFIKQEPPESPPPLLHLQSSKMEPRIQVGDMAPSCGSSPDSIDYKSNPFVKPPYSYASLICMAMKATKKNKITLSSIYNWITDNFMYYRLTDPSWQNSIRHNLSLNKCFEKVARRKDEPGKGGFWRINPDYGDMVENGVFKKRRNSRDVIPSPPPKRYKLDDDDFPSISGMKCSAREDKLLSNGSLAELSMDDDDDDKNLALKGDFNWTSILSQDIDIGGRTVKTEVILDEAENSPFMAMSPPSSETNSDDLGLDDLFSQTDFAMDLPVDFQTNDPLDLTVQGTTIRPPEWWNTDANNNNHNVHNHNDHNSGLNTPVPPSPESEHGGDAMWGEGLNLGASGNFSSGNFDLDNLFDIDNIPSPQL